MVGVVMVAGARASCSHRMHSQEGTQKRMPGLSPLSPPLHAVHGMALPFPQLDLLTSFSLLGDTLTDTLRLTFQVILESG